ncbi:MAG: hypothetical protein EP348_09545 [Alphaproteobacteria bacterium]|nr:MAG: hypothetical protein EP348_09545 [Alphaproteobacteria bacterium]
MARFFTTSRYRSHGRKDHRHELPQLKLTLAGREFTTYDWSLGGFRIDDFQGRPIIGELMTVTDMSYEDIKLGGVKSTATVTRIVIGKNQVAFAFNRLDEKAFSFLEAASMKRLSRLARI